MRKIKKVVLAVLVYFLLGLRFVLPVLAQTWSDPSGEAPAQLKDLEVVFASVISIAIQVGGIAVLLMLISGGFQYAFAGDNPKSMEKATKTLTAAFIGLVVIISAWLIIQAIEKITGLEISVFRIG